MRELAQDVVLHEGQNSSIVLVLVVMGIDIDDQHVVEIALMRLLARMRKSRVVLSSSTVTRRPRSAMRSMAFLLAFPKFRKASAARPALPHAELEHREIGGF